MKKNLVALSSRIAENANKLIISELEKNNIKGIVPSHGGILMLLYTYDRLTMNEIAQKIHRTKPTVTILVDKLVKFGFVTKTKSDIDSRTTYLNLTKKGEELKPIFENISNTLNEKIYRNLSVEESEKVEEILEKVLNNLE